MEEEKVVEVEVKQEEKKDLGQIYIRLEGIYEADVQVEPGKHVQAFLLRFTDLGGSEFMCPLTCKENYKETLRKYLGKLTPLHLSFNLKETEKKDESSGQVVDITDMAPNREAH
jgi:hypothetical protein